MGKVSKDEKQSKNGRQKRISRKSNNKYLKPGALAQLSVRKALGSKSCTDLGKKRVAVNSAKQSGSDDSETNQLKNIDTTPTRLSPAMFQFAPPVFGPSDAFSPNNSGNTTPRTEVCESESRLESLPTDLLVKILCHLHHDQLRAVFHVSQKIRKAVVQARQYYFNFTTPDRTRQEMLNAMTPLHTDRWPFMSKGGRNGIFISSPHTPKAPKHGPRPPSRLRLTEMKQVAAVLFKEPKIESKFSVIQKPICKSLASNRVLFYEDELCQAVAQNKLR
ncbi:hypothetical protein ACS0TY_029626 [Phlomoides rotata]